LARVNQTTRCHTPEDYRNRNSPTINFSAMADRQSELFKNALELTDNRGKATITPAGLPTT